MTAWRTCRSSHTRASAYESAGQTIALMSPSSPSAASELWHSCQTGNEDDRTGRNTTRAYSVLDVLRVRCLCRHSRGSADGMAAEESAEAVRSRHKTQDTAKIQADCCVYGPSTTARARSANSVRCEIEAARECRQGAASTQPGLRPHATHCSV